MSVRVLCLTLMEGLWSAVDVTPVVKSAPILPRFL